MTTDPPVSPAPSALTGRGAPYADVRETHSGVVILVGDRAYKLKKLVDLGFLDFSTRKLRLRACRGGSLNRRFAPDVYLGVADIIGPDGDPEDHMVVMRGCLTTCGSPPWFAAGLGSTSLSLGGSP